MGDEEQVIKFNPLVAGGEEIRKNFNYSLTVKTDMNDEMATDAQEVAVTCIEKSKNNYEQASKMLQDELTKKYGGGWQVVMGEGFGMEITHDHGSLLYCYSAGQVAILVWKCN
eukprot:m.399141 g.399141  ORF g.399141 m.399141 type:complete len:113 (+) comp28378_c2_seq1:82-420(+)